MGLDMKVVSSVRINIDGYDKAGFSVDKSMHNMLFDKYDDFMDVDSTDIITKGLTDLKNNSRCLTLTLHKGDDYKTVESIRYTYCGYDGKEWMKRPLIDGCYYETTDYVKTSDIKKTYKEYMIKANTIATCMR